MKSAPQHCDRAGSPSPFDTSTVVSGTSENQPASQEG
jgi:hypothetical protein